MVLPEGLLKILACPVDKGCLMYLADEDLLYNPRLRRAYRIVDGIPVMLAERAEPVSEAEHERLMGRACEAGSAVPADSADATGVPVAGAPVPGAARPLPGHRGRGDPRPGR